MSVNNDFVPNRDSSRRKAKLTRFFSTESTVSGFRYQSYLEPPDNNKEYEFKFCGRDLIFKLTELLIAIVSSGLYSRGLFVMPYDKTNESTITNLMFPNVVFSSFIIITSVIAMSYVLGQRIPEVIIRIFNAIGAILHFISATITLIVWNSLPELEDKEEKSAGGMLFAQIFTSFMNSVVYSVDFYFSLRTVLHHDDEVVEQ